MPCGPVAAGTAGSRTNTWGSIGFAWWVSLEKKAAWVSKVKRLGLAAPLGLRTAVKVKASATTNNWAELARFIIATPRRVGRKRPWRSRPCRRDGQSCPIDVKAYSFDPMKKLQGRRKILFYSSRSIRRNGASVID